MVMTLKIGKRSRDEFEIALWLNKCAKAHKPQWIAIDNYDANW